MRGNHRGWTLAENEYGRYAVPMASSHRPAAKQILDGRVYEPKTIDYIRRHCRDGHVMHAGAYFGDFLPAISAAMAPSRCLFAFEPNPENFECIGITSTLSLLDNLIPYQMALGEVKGLATLVTHDSLGKSHGGASYLCLDPDLLDAKTVEVAVTTIDDVLPSPWRVSLIHLDVERHEEQALRGAIETIRQWLPVLVIEVLDDSDVTESQWWQENIVPLGYRLDATMHGNQAWAVLR